MMHRILQVTGRSDYSIEIDFESGERAIVDLAGFVADGEVTRRLREDPGYFIGALTVVDDGEAIGWPGEVHIDADALWYKAHPEDWGRDFDASPNDRLPKSA